MIDTGKGFPVYYSIRRPIMENTMRRRVALAWCCLLILQPFLAAQETEVQPHPVDTLAIGTIATVGTGRIRADEVFELWTPVWYETLAKVRNGKMSPQEGDAKLDQEWRRAIMALIKDEAFYQEAERENQSIVNNIVNNYMRQGAAERDRERLTREIRKAMQQDMDRYFRELSNDMVKESGGMLKLRKVLQGRGLTFQEWQNRLKKKAFTQSYLAGVIKPRAPNPGPKQIQEYYAANTDEFALPGLVRFRHIFFSKALHGEDGARDRAVEAWERIMDEEISFADAVREYSDDDESKGRGGEETGENALDPEREAWLADIRSALRDESPGEMAPILESPFGCHLAVLVSIGQDRKMPFAEVSRDIERKLTGRIWEEETDRYFYSIQKSTDIKVLMQRFPQHLSCAAQVSRDVRAPTVYSIGGGDPVIRSGRR